MPSKPAPRLFLAAACAALLTAVVATGAGSGAAVAQTKKPDPAIAIKARQDNFKAIGGAFKAVRGELGKDAPDYALVTAKAQEINARAGKIVGLFPAGTGPAPGLKTEALPAIWKNPAAFKTAAQKLADESAKLAATARKGDKAAIAAQTMAVGGTCKGCHDQFRLESK